MDMWDYFKMVIVGCILVGIISFITLTLAMPKPHQGYYLDVRYHDQIYPVFQIYNNWKWYPDTVAFVTPNQDVCLSVFEKLTSSVAK